MQVVIISNLLSKHGLNPTYAEALAQQLSGAEIAVFSASSRLNVAARMLDMLVSVLRCWRWKAMLVLELYSGPRAIIYGRVVTALCRAIGLRYVVILAGGNLPALLKRSPHVLERVLGPAWRVIAPSEYLAATIRQLRDVRVIPNAIEVDRYEFTAYKAIGPRLLFLRSFHRWTRPQDAIACLKSVLDEFPNATLTLAGCDEGDGTLEECQSLIDQLHLRAAVRIAGRLPKSSIYALSRDHDIFLHTMLVDNTPVSVIEAMALGMCIVATRVGGVPYLLENEQTALLVEPEDVPAMAAAVRRYLTDPSLAAKLRCQARRQADTMSWKVVLPQWIDLLREFQANA